MATLRQKQISKLISITFLKIIVYTVKFSDALKQMLNLNQTQGKTNISEPVWKILVYDRIGQDIISPLISVKELREQGVTLFL